MLETWMLQDPPRVSSREMDDVDIKLTATVNKFIRRPAIFGVGVQMRLPAVTKSKLLSSSAAAAAALAVTAAVGEKRAAEQGCLALLQACNTVSKLEQIHSHILKLGLHSNLPVLTKFAAVSSHLHDIDYGSSFLFSRESNVVSYDAFLFNTVIKAYAQTTNLKGKAVCFYNLMRECGVLPNEFTHPVVFKACAGIGELNLGMSVHGSVLKSGFDGKVHVQNALVHMYCCCGGGLDIGRKVFDEMPKRNSVSWVAMIGGYACLGRCSEGIDLFRQMQMAGVRPDEITWVPFLSVCTELGALELGKWVESCIQKERVQKSVELCNALIDMFAKCGDVEKAIELFRNMSERNLVSWTSVIVGFGMHGRGQEAVALFEEMIENGVAPDDAAFIGLLSACSHSGLVDEGKEYFYSMRSDFGIVPKIEHFGCMADMLCRAGLVKEAVEFVHQMPIEPNTIIWRNLIDSCHAHGEFELGERITRQLIENEPSQDSNYVMLSNIYAKMSAWEKKIRTRRVMERKGIRKVPGSTMIESSLQFHGSVGRDEVT